MKILGLVPARSGSRRVPDKNIRSLGGKPLMAWTIETALQAGLGAVFVSTDSEKYKEIVRQYGALTIDRPPELSGDVDTGLVAKHLLIAAEDLNTHYDAVMVLQPTSPFRSVDDIKDCVKLYNEGKVFDTVLTVKKVTEHPAWLYRGMRLTDKTGSLENFLGFPSRIMSGLIAQELPSLMFPNGAVYLVSRETVLRGRIFGDSLGYVEMPPDRSLDIETEWDMRLAEFMLEMKEK